MHPASASRDGTLREGDVIAGKYAIVKVLGEGGMGVVYEATHLRLRQRVAVKMLQQDMLGHEIVVTRFEREARAAGQLRSRHTARVMDVDVTGGGLPYMVMEFLEGNDLESELEQRGRLPVAEAVDYVLQACSAMIEAHQLGIVHRDLKPANLFLANDGGTRVIKLLDFGISKLESEGDSKLTTPESVMGTALYMSPEQVRASGTVDARSDIWSLGIILYELLSGRTPWTGTPTQLAAAIVTEEPPELLSLCDVPLELAAIIGKALRRDADDRWPDVRELALALAPYTTPNGSGRILVYALFEAAQQRSSPRLTGQPPRADLPTATPLHARAVSEARPHGEGTAPGWSQRSRPRSTNRTLLVGLVSAFGLGFVVLGALALAWLRWGSPRPPAESALAPPRATSATAAATGPSTTVEPSPSAVTLRDPEPTIAQPPASSAETVHSAEPVGARPHASAVRPTVKPFATAKPRPTVDSNGLPLHL